jgi:hypothetical protein
MGFLNTGVRLSETSDALQKWEFIVKEQDEGLGNGKLQSGDSSYIDIIGLLLKAGQDDQFPPHHPNGQE